MSRAAQRQIVVRQRASTVQSPYSNKRLEPDWSNPDLLVVHGVSIQPGQGSEDTERAQELTADWTLEAIGYPDIRAEDRIVANEGTFDVAGPVGRWPGRHPATTTTLTRRTG